VIGVIDYGMGNLRSVLNAFDAIGKTARSVSEPTILESVSAIVLPGVGAFSDGMANLRDRGFVTALDEEVRRKGKPFLGLCLGLQLLAEKGTEHGDHTGLGWIAGTCKRIAVPPKNPDLRVPHIGWNDVEFSQDDGIYRDLGEAQAFYFVHSYVMHPDDPSIVTGRCDHGENFAASIQLGHVSATQYHPEKSQGAGLKVLSNWCDLARC